VTFSVRPSFVLAVIERMNWPAGRPVTFTAVAIRARVIVNTRLPSTFTVALIHLTWGSLRSRIVSSCPLTHCFVDGSTNADASEIGLTFAASAASAAGLEANVVAAAAARIPSVVASSDMRNALVIATTRGRREYRCGWRRRACSSCVMTGAW
jgi:hypothetical protein